MAYDISDFSKGIVTDVDPRDAGDGSLEDCVNFDLYPGEARTRYGTATKTFVEYAYDLQNDVYVPIGQIPLHRGGEIIQIEETKCPDARAGSIRGFATAPTLTGNPEERCLNDRVTAILCRKPDGKYWVFADVYEKDKFILLRTFFRVGAAAADEDLTCADPGSVPYMIPRQSGFAIGNVITSTGERGVVVFVHMKKLGYWGLWGTTQQRYAYYRGVDDWRCFDAECYDAVGGIKWMLYYSNVEQSWDHNSPMATEFKGFYNLFTHEEMFKRLLSPFQIGGRPANFNIKLTAIFDGYQESRPLPFSGMTRSSPLFYLDPTGTPIQYGRDTLPDNWSIEPDPKTGQHVRVQMRPVQRFVAWARTLGRTSGRFYTRGNFPDDLTGTEMKWYVKVLWNRPWSEEQDSEVTGEGFVLEFGDEERDPGEWATYAYGSLQWKFVGGRRMGLRITTRIKATGFNGYFPLPDWPSDQDIRLEKSLGWFLFMIGQTDDFPVDSLVDISPLNRFSDNDRNALRGRGWERNFPSLIGERNICKQLFRAAEWYLYTIPPYTFNSPENLALATFHTGATFEDYNDEVFRLEDYAGRAILAVFPYVPTDLAMAYANIELGHQGVPRLTGFRLYVKEDDVDIDYRLLREIRLDKNPKDPDFGGAEEGQLVEHTARDGQDAPMWGRETWYPPFLGNPIELIRPYHAQTFVPVNSNARTILQYRGGIHTDFIISDTDLTDTAGNSVLSQNMQRDETYRDAPLWIRGAMCEGRLLGIRYTDKQVAYCIVGGGVPQYDIMPREAIHVGTNDIPTHIVSWRDSFHLIFTDRSIFRMDFADGDEMHWRVLSTYAGHGTELWRAIVNTPDAVYYVNRDGVFAYAGGSPQDLTWGFWKKTFRENYSAKLTEENAFGGYNSREKRVLFSLAGPENDHRVWVFDGTMKAWWKYVYRGIWDDYASPLYMTMNNNEFLISFGPTDLRKVDFESHVDGGFPGRGYTCYLVTNELEPSSQVDLGFMQYIGFKYIPSALGLRYKLCYGPYLKNSEATWWPYKAVKSVKLPADRDNFLHPMPSGIARLWKLMIGAGDAFLNRSGTPMQNPQEITHIRLVSVRGTSDPQWGGT